MRMILRGVSLAIVSCILAGCGGDSSQSTDAATPENPQAGLDAMKKMQAPLDPKAAAKGASAVK